jgi:putative oxidoreductase
MPSSLVVVARRKVLSLLSRLEFAAGLLTRLVVGFAFYDSGGGKLANMENTVAFFTDLGIPFPELNAAFVARLEHYGGMLLLAGVATRLVAALLSSTMVVAILTADRGTFLDALLRRGEAGLSDVAPFVLLVFLSWLVIRGAGVLSGDALIARALDPAKDDAPGATA